MKLIKKIAPVAVATSMALAGLAAAPTAANAEVSASMGVASFYLWRGLDISGGAPEVSGSLDYSNESGVYAGIWTTSEAGGSETDLYFGFGGEAGAVSYDLSYWTYLYPSDNPLVGGGDSTLSEFVVNVGVSDFGFTLYKGIDVDAPGPGDDYNYVTLDYSFGDFNVLYGQWMWDQTVGSDDSHITFSYAATDNFTFTASKGFQDTPAGTAYDEDILFHVAYSLPVDFK